MILHNKPTALIEGGHSTLANPLYIGEDGKLKTFDYIKKTLIKSVRGEYFPFTPSIHRAGRGTGEATSHSTWLPNNSSQVAGYQDERKMYRTITST